MTAEPLERADAVPDGRRRRGVRSRDSVIDAILDLLQEGVEQPTTTLIAERSGVSVRSVFRHFDDVESLYTAAVERHSERIAPLFALSGVTGDLDARVTTLVDHRVRLYPAMGNVRRAAERLRSSSAVVRERLDVVRDVLREHLETVFAAELVARPPADRATVLDALEAVSSWYAWQELTVVQGCDADAAAAAMRHAVRAVLAC